MPSKKIKCSCVSPFQDGEYGVGVRIANEMRSGQLKCTVCGTISGAKGMTQSEAVSAKVSAKATTKKAEPAKADEKKDDKKKKGLKGTKR